jgi:hypothetical protein
MLDTITDFLSPLFSIELAAGWHSLGVESSVCNLLSSRDHKPPDVSLALGCRLEMFESVSLS